MVAYCKKCGDRIRWNFVDMDAIRTFTFRRTYFHGTYCRFSRSFYVLLDIVKKTQAFACVFYIPI
ncbi:hypothetical protein GGQ84_001020 [Desulfitispora alkaliphila]